MKNIYLISPLIWSYDCNVISVIGKLYGSIFISCLFVLWYLFSYVEF